MRGITAYFSGTLLSILLFFPLLYILFLRYHDIAITAITLVVLSIIAISASLIGMKDSEKKFKEGFEAFPSLVSRTITSIMLVFVYIIVVGIIHIFAKLTRKRFLARRKKGDTYWERYSEELSNMDPWRMF